MRLRFFYVPSAEPTLPTKNKTRDHFSFDISPTLQQNRAEVIVRFQHAVFFVVVGVSLCGCGRFSETDLPDIGSTAPSLVPLSPTQIPADKPSPGTPSPLSEKNRLYSSQSDPPYLLTADSKKETPSQKNSPRFTAFTPSEIGDIRAAPPKPRQRT